MPPKVASHGAKGLKGEKKAAIKAEAARSGDKKKQHRRRESYAIYVYEVLKQVHPDTIISSKTMSMLRIWENLILIFKSTIRKDTSFTLMSRECYFPSPGTDISTHPALFPVHVT